MGATWGAVEQHLHRLLSTVSLELTWACVRAVHHVGWGEWEKRITMPSGETLTAREIVRRFSLGEFIEGGK